MVKEQMMEEINYPTIVLDQNLIVQQGLHERTNLSDWVVLQDIYSQWLRAGKEWVTYRYPDAIVRTPIAHINCKGAMSMKVNRLKRNGFIQSRRVVNSNLVEVKLSKEILAVFQGADNEIQKGTLRAI